MGAGRTRVAWLVLALLLLGGCSTVSGWFGSDNKEKLPGKRIAVLGLERGVTADSELANLQVRLPEPYVNGRWTQYGGNAAHAMYHLTLGESPRQAWSADLGDGSASDRVILAQPVVVDGKVYGMDAVSTVSAYDTAQGHTLWRADLKPEEERRGYFGGGIAFDDGRIFVTTGFAEVIALDAADGKVIWRQHVPAPMRAAPAAEAGRVFAVTIDNETIALSADDGRQLWTYSGIQEATSLVGGASPAVAGSVVVSPYSSGEIIALQADNGRVLWSDTLAAVTRIDPLADIGQIRGAPVIDRDLVFAVSHAGRAVAIDLRRGLRVWERDIGGVEMPWAAGDFVFLLTNDAQLVCLTRQDGRVRWVRPLDRFENPESQKDPIQWTGPVLAGDRLIVAGSHGKAVSVSPYTGEILGTMDLPGAVTIAPTVAGSSLFFVTDGGDLIAMH